MVILASFVVLDLLFCDDAAFALFEEPSTAPSSSVASGGSLLVAMVMIDRTDEY